MPEGVDGPRMVASPDKEVVYIVGGSGPSGKKIFKFSCLDDQIQHCQWEEMATRLTYPRWASIAMSIPDDLVNKLCD